jgi:uncharacterized protein YndB with AHSA1/START domain
VIAERAIQWRVHLEAKPGDVYALISTDEGRRRFWADSADEVEAGIIEFRFRSGDQWRGTILRREPPRIFALTYLGGAEVTFDVDPDPAGGTVLTVTETGTRPEEWLDNYAGWVSLLLTLKGALDFGVDLRNGSPSRSWRNGFVDV